MPMRHCNEARLLYIEKVIAAHERQVDILLDALTRLCILGECVFTLGYVYGTVHIGTYIR